jgi:lysyl endopeptidase
MQAPRTLTSVALLAAVILAPSPTFAADWEAWPWEAQAALERDGELLDPTLRQARMGRLQQTLAGREVARGLGREIVVEPSARDRKSIDVPEAKGGPYLVGVSQPVDVEVSFPVSASPRRARELAWGAIQGTEDGGFVWSAVVRSPGATALRLELAGLDLPPGAELYVYNAQGHAFGPYTGRGPLGDGELYTHSVFGEELRIQLVSPVAGARVAPLRLAGVGVMGQRFVLPRFGPQGAFDPNDLEALSKASNLCSYNADCVVNAACASTHSAVSQAKDAIATMLYKSGGGYYICTGGLIADTDTTTVVPYFLTANHCISSGRVASSLETFFDYETSCNSPNCTQPYNNTGETVGATIKASNSTGDYTLLQLASTPTTPDGVVAYLGWTTTAVANSNGVALYRISHPAGAPQAYSEQVVDTSKGTCQTLPRGTYIYSEDTLGATEGGSSGSPVVNGAGQVVGQLYGACGTNVNDSCDANSNATVDGAFAAYYSAVAPFLAPSGGGGGGGCASVGAACTSNSQCCSNSCKGKPGAKVCK